MNDTVVGEVDTTKCPQCGETYGDLDSWFNKKTMNIDENMRFICQKCREMKWDPPSHTWFRARDVLPPHMQEVLVKTTHNGRNSILHFCHMQGKWFNQDDTELDGFGIDYWMVIPPLPNDK